MRLLVIGVVSVAILLGVVVLIGAFLPREHTASSTIRLSASPDSVWTLVRDLGAYAEWWPNVQRVEPIAGRESEAWRQIDRRNGALPLEVIEDQPPTRLVTRIIDEGMPFGGTWTYDVAPDDGGTRVTITEDGAVYNPLFRFVSRYLMGHHGTMDGYLKSLGTHLGENVAPVHVERH